MKITKKHTIYIDTKLDKLQKPSNFNVKLNNWFIRNNIKNSDKANSEWFMSIKTFAMFNSFSNISTGINDKLILYVSNSEVTPDLLTTSDTSFIAGNYTVIDIFLPDGNPNVIDIQNEINRNINIYGIQCEYKQYDSKFKFFNTPLSTDKRKKYILFDNTYDLLGFEQGKLYRFYNKTDGNFKSEKPVNLLADRLIKFTLGNNSDIRLKEMNFCNHNSVYDECNMFALFPVNVQSYELIYYQRSSEDLIPIELLGNSIRNIEILARNQENDIVEGLSDYIMVLELINIKEYDYEKRIYNVLKEIYLWVATFLRWRI